MKIWQVVSKLSYTAYIVHFQWQIIADGTLRTPEYFGFVEMVSSFPCNYNLNQIDFNFFF